MSGELADMLGGALAANPHPVQSTDGESAAPCGLLAMADRIRAALVAEGVAPHEPVHIRIGNRPVDIGALLGVWRAGAVAVPLHVAAATATKDRVAASTRARFVVDGERIERIAAPAPPQRALLAGAALIMFTSGTTGLPKGAVVGHRRLADKLAVLDGLLALRPDDTVLVPLQMTFIFGLWVALLTLRSGSRLVLVPKFSTDVMARGFREATVVGAVPSAYRTLMFNLPAAPALRMAMTGGEVLAPHLARGLQAWSPAAIVDLYGLTETGTCDFCCGPAEQPQGFGSIGRQTPRVAYRIASDGELLIKSPFGMLGFLDNPALTAASFADGFYRTGDLVRLNGHGFVELIGRAKDVVSRGGTKIAPLEIDHLIAEHPAVAAALCAGVPDERLGEVLHAAVVRREGCDLDSAALRAWLLERTERYKVPEVFYFVDALPAGSTGKADRRAVTAMAAKR